MSSSLGCLEYVKENAQRGDPASVVRTIDEFASNHMMMNVGKGKSELVDAEIRRKQPAIMAELGSYTGYSTVRFANAQREAAGEKPSHYYAFEYSPVYASRVREVRVPDDGQQHGRVSDDHRCLCQRWSSLLVLRTK